MTRPTKASLILGLTLYILSGKYAAFGGTIILPNANATTEGNLSGNPLTPTSAVTFQIVFGSSQMAGVPLGGQITGLAFRFNGGIPSGPPSAVTYPNFVIRMSTSLNPPGSLSSTFSDNIGPDALTVFSGPLTFLPNSFPGGMTPNAFGPVIPFSDFYTYNGGNLLITVQHAAGTGPAFTLDAQQLTPSVTEEIIGVGFSATTGVNNPSVITQLSFQAIPEPASIVLVSIGGIPVLLGSLRSSLARRKPKQLPRA